MSHAVVHFEILGDNPADLRAFYKDNFQWKVNSVEMPNMEYAMVEKDADYGIGGAIGSSPMGGNSAVFYIEVDDVQAALDKIEKSGGKTVVPVVELPMVTFAQFADPAGNVVGLSKTTPA